MSNKTSYVRVAVSLAIPPGATHYSGDLLDDPTFWRWKANSTGTVMGWQYWNARRGEWMLGSEQTPHFLQAIPFASGEPEFRGVQTW